MSYDVNGQKISLQAGEGIFVNSHSLHYGYSDTHTECFFLCILLSPRLLSVNTYFIENCLNPLVQNIHFPYQKLNPAIQWQNSILHDLEMIYENNIENVQPFIILEKTSHIFRLLSENMDFFPDHDKNAEDILAEAKQINEDRDAQEAATVEEAETAEETVEEAEEAETSEI